MPDDDNASNALASCQVCLDLEWDHFPSVFSGASPKSSVGRVRNISVRVQRIIKGGKKGCQPCYAIARAIELMQGIDDSLGSRLHETQPSLAQLVLRRGPLPLEVWVILAYERPPAEDRIARFTFEMFADIAKPSPWRAFAPARQITPKLHSKRRQKIIHEWIDTCNNDHKICKFPPNTESNLPPPKRLVDLGSNPRKIVKLVDSDHVWGHYATVIHNAADRDDRPIQTLSLNLEAHQAGIRWFELPVAYQEAIVTALEQKIRYIWIPSLCIVQDDEEDRRWHMDRQDLIFRNSYLTIAFSSAKNSHHSSFGPRRLNGAESSIQKTFDITLSERGHHYLVHARDSQFHTHHRFGANSDSSSVGYLNVPNSDSTVQLLSEPYAFQQLLLSARVIHFHGSEMVWECAGCIKCECTWLDNRKTPRQGLRARLQLHAPTSNEWNDVRKKYSKLHHTDKTAKLIHLAGLARRWSQLTQNVHLAGLFARTPTDLAKELLWRATRLAVRSHSETGNLDELMTYRYHDPSIPSWSWASMSLGRAEITDSVLDLIKQKPLSTFKVDGLFRYLDVSFVPLPGGRGDQYLAREWTLYLSGRLLLGRISAPIRGRTCTFAPANRSFLPRYPDVENAPVVGAYPHWSAHPTFEADCDVWNSLHNRDRGSPLAYFLKLGRFNYDADVKDVPVELGIVLCRTPARHPSKRDGLERIGTFSVPMSLCYFMQAQVQDVRLV